MERLEAESERLTRRGILAKNKAEGVLYPPGQCGHKLTLPRPPRAPSNELKLAAVAVDLNVRPRSADMPPTMQERAFRYTRALLDAYPEKKPSPTQLAMCLKKEFDATYGMAWHCIVGKSFGSFVTHSNGGFVYFSVDKLSFLLFKTVVRQVKSPSQQKR
ncbi:hypothetical protein I3842_03G088900 [Carya illinoinensis]|uniref:Dynein light chain n=1 Tax=Carya illinoinensis TaxID=32201 RepID=A0A922JUI3_CARIL|nr:hypothetical protein I3842_03G088900 [Carya illinoinensis]